MIIQQSLYPALETGIHITKFIENHLDEPVLLLLSGGSALGVLEHIATEHFSSLVHVGLTDERFTDHVEGSTFVRIEKTLFYTQAIAKGVQFINSKKERSESHKSFCARLQTCISVIEQDTANIRTLGLFGIGEDGHTASIFPGEQITFATLYESEDFYVPVTTVDTYPQRISITIPAIEKLDEVVIYATGKNKCENILTQIQNKQLEPNQLPATVLTKHQNCTLYTDCSTLT